MEKLSNEQKETLSQLYLHAYNSEKIEHEIGKWQLSEEGLADAYAYLKKLRLAGRTRMGTILIVCGVIILGAGFLSCVYWHYKGENIDFSLYGLTGIGAVLLIAGLVMVLG